MATPNTALEMISLANLSRTEHLLLKHFVEKAVDPVLAAQYLLSRVQSDAVVEGSLRSFKQDWKRLVSKLRTFDKVPNSLDTLVRRRDGPGCCMMNNSELRNKRFSEQGLSIGAVESAYVIPPSMLRDIESDEGSLREILEAFLSPSGVRQLKSAIETHDDTQNALRNLWCLSPSIHDAFREGHIKVEAQAEQEKGREIGPSSENKSREKYKDEYILSLLHPDAQATLRFADGEAVPSIFFFKLSTSASALSLPSSFLFEVHGRFATALHLFSIDDKIERGWPRPKKDPVPAFIRRAFYHLSRWLPLWVRMQFYAYLWKVGNRRWGPLSVPWVQRLPFGLIMKQCIRAPQSEPNALRLVEKHTTIPAPRLVDVGVYAGKTYMIMTCLPGQQLDEVSHLMSYAECDRLADDLADCVAQLRRIPNHTPYRFANTVGGPLCDHRLPNEGPAGPFNNEADFNNYLTSHLECTPDKVLEGQDLTMRQDHQSYFTHSDFFSMNILVENGRLSGIVDWECAGYMPEYWECIKARRHTHRDPVWAAICRRVFGEAYQKEWEIEKILWRYTPFGV
ncbi:hypothetical protein N7462_000662 [Penicillium macrosclerotiorum]|uniref:uncharacterized protein n=1 Tax=Penicillium macrosclerotiorum TaxID=303699 RepID=UPI002547250A|nr:uncharacterized protein N7462_000662 [Penicillium macrosclerotiorum]KAJ5698657.1 hypothetical protein N7462_000662 [Penicillium macrosclerotiorum]